ncbi:AraC family transcriptional regulator [Micromonospora sp. NPDC005298]|uniref:AraC family transcriptional regulator n=1 Tax=Micromonospora sp. NPDC005298 TaxID=3156873 RepID=UPI0033B4FFF4
MAIRPASSQVSAWRPAVAGVAEVFHARFVDHAYPRHVHDVWTLLIVDAGAVRFDLDRHRHGALRTSVTLLPPYVPHDGRSATPDGFRKRVLYLDTSALAADLVGRAVDEPDLADPRLRDRIHHLHHALATPGEEFEAESRLALVLDRLRGHLLKRAPVDAEPAVSGLAGRLRELLDDRTVEGVTLREAAELLHAHPTHLVRSFTRAHGLPPHSYLTGRRVEVARRLLLAGQRPAEAATAAGFFDQAHLNRHFRRFVGVTPARYPATATTQTS